ncbi:MAG: phosphotransferase [Anaerolineae bacterium]|nr:phosphotransferase [Anaerolineae bacterium]
MNLTTPIAYGRTAEIYAVNDTTVLKLFHTWVDEASVRHEARLAHAVYAAGLPTPPAGEVIKVEGRWGLEYGRLAGKAMGDAIAERPWILLRSARQLAELHAAVHAVPAIGSLPSLHERLAQKIQAAQELSADLKTAALTALGQMPAGNSLCHGDFHPMNVIITPNGAQIIDWIDATNGNPLGDVARTAVLLMGISNRNSNEAGVPPLWIEKLAMAWYARLYLKHYFTLRPGGETEYRRWRPIVAAGRISENIPGMTPWLLKQVKREIHNSPTR